MFKIQRQQLAIQIVTLGLTNCRKTWHNLVLTRNCCEWVLHEFRRSQDDFRLCMHVLYNHESVVRHVTILQHCTTVARHLPTSIDIPYKQAIF